MTQSHGSKAPKWGHDCRAAEGDMVQKYPTRGLSKGVARLCFGQETQGRNRRWENAIRERE